MDNSRKWEWQRLSESEQRRGADPEWTAQCQERKGIARQTGGENRTQNGPYPKISSG